VGTGPLRAALSFLFGTALSLLVLVPVSHAITLPADFADQTVATGLDRPTSLAFTPDGRLLIGEEAGQVRIYENGGLATGSALDISANVCSDQERGLMSVAVDPAFTSNHYIYVYYTFNKFGGVCEYGSDGSTRFPVNRVSRFVLGDDDHVDPASETVLIDNIPAPEGYHIGADLHFGNDGYLYVSTGDGGCNYATHVWCNQYNDASRYQYALVGKVLRITRDGAVPPTNPFLGPDSARCAASGVTTSDKKCQETFAWGLRNPFRMAFDPNYTGTRFFINDVGETTWEEIDLAQAGADYGWNVREGHCATGSQTDCGPPPAGMTNPIYDYSHDSGCASITAGAFVPNGIWPAAYDRSYLFGDLVCGKIFKLDQRPDGSWAQTDFAQGFGAYGLITMAFDSHGTWALYYVNWAAASGKEIHRIVYTGAARGYPRPRGATPFRVPLVPAYAACSTPNRMHGGPLAGGSCNPPGQASSQLTVGTLDANGKASNATGRVRYDVVPGNASTPADEADVKLAASLTDVRQKTSLADYTGDLRVDATVRVTDRLNGPSQSEPATVSDLSFPATIPCAATADSGTGGSCALATSFDALVPGTIVESKRSIWQLGQIKVYDAGPDGLASTTGDNTLFQNEGIFVP